MGGVLKCIQYTTESRFTLIYGARRRRRAAAEGEDERQAGGGLK
jgi:hypothetical protein